MIRMVGFPEWGQNITVETWPKGIDRLFAFRDFRILNSDGTVIGAATSSWMILDHDTPAPQKCRYREADTSPGDPPGYHR